MPFTKCCSLKLNCTWSILSHGGASRQGGASYRGAGAEMILAQRHAYELHGCRWLCGWKGGGSPGCCHLGPWRGWGGLCGWAALPCAAKAMAAVNLPASRLGAVAWGALGGCFCPVNVWLLGMYFRQRQKEEM